MLLMPDPQCFIYAMGLNARQSSDVECNYSFGASKILHSSAVFNSVNFNVPLWDPSNLGAGW